MICFNINARKFLPIFFLFTVLFSCQGNSSTPIKGKDIIKKMSIEDKLLLLSGSGNTRPINVPNILRGAAGYINGISNDDINLPGLILSDGPAGVRIDKPTTAWPIGTLLASSWNSELVESVGKAMGEEALEYGVDLLLAPGMNLQRNPLAGRNFEYYSEDPLLTGKIGAAMVNGIQSTSVGATLKHFFGNESETNRNYINVISDSRASREIYLRAFEIAVKESNPDAIMSSYNLVNGLYTNQNFELLEDILRGEWNFKGFVLSDWFAGNVRRDINSAGKQIKAGNDLIMPGSTFTQLQHSYESGLITIEEIDRSVLRIINQILKSPKFLKSGNKTSLDLEAHKKLAREAGTEGIILLKNDNNTLPIDKQSSVAVYGVAQYNTYKGGSGSGNVNSEYVVDIISGLKGTFNVNSELDKFYRDYFLRNRTSLRDGFAGIPIYSVNEAPVEKENELDELMNKSTDETAIITISRQAGEGRDRAPIKGQYYLNDTESNLIKIVSERYHKNNRKVIVVLNIDGVIDTQKWSKYVDGIILAYMGGQETGNQIADIISGKVNPSGKLTQTFPKNYDDVPSALTFPGLDVNKDGYPDIILNNESIYVGYRYYTTFNKDVSYPFGFGLSYTNFEISESQIADFINTNEDGYITVNTKVTNIGDRAGKEVLQLYIKAPNVKLSKPDLELKSFGKTKLLKSGESQNIELTIKAWEIASFDPERNCWIIEPGNYYFYLSNSSKVNEVKPLVLKIDKEIITSKTSDSLKLPNGLTKEDFVNIK